MLRQLFFVAIASAAATAACGPAASTNGSGGGNSDGTGSGSGGAGGTFLPFASSFSGYHSWRSFHLAHGTQPDGVHDVDAPLTAYINKLPPKGATAFPVGTIIVKEVEQGPITTRQIFAIVKVGGDYNAKGVVNWEWFEVTRNPGPGDTVRIVWSGVQPPPGDPYSKGVKGACNGCHEGAKSNDYIWSAPLNLEKLEDE